MISQLLLYLLISDLRDFSDNDLHEALELLLGCPVESLSPALEELREAILDQLRGDHLDRAVIASWPEDYCELLPEQMMGYLETKDDFCQLFEETPAEAEEEENDRMSRFRLCLDLLDEGSDWKQRSLAARTLGALEEELFQLRDGAVSPALTMAECTPTSVVSHRHLLEGFEMWQQAFRLTHSGQLDEASEEASEACRLFRAVQIWTQKAGA